MEYPINGIYRTEDSYKELEKFTKGQFDAIITDPEYKDKGKLDPDRLKWICKGNIVVYCKPENQFFQADQYCFWIKQLSTKNFGANTGRYVEMILILRQGKTFNKLYWGQMPGVYYDVLENPPLHPYEKPEALIGRMIRMLTKPGDVILDLFSGSGTTSFMAQKLNRRFFAFDWSQKWVDYGRMRLAGATYEELKAFTERSK